MSSAPPNQSGPLLSHGAEPPGGVVDGIWRGELNWRTQHGPAMVQWSMGVPTYVWNAIKSTAAESTTGRVNVRGRYPASDLFRVDANNSRAHGRIRIMPDDVEFSVIEQLPAPEIEDEFMPLAELLRADNLFVADLASDETAAALYAVVENEAFVDAAGRVFEFGQRSAAHFVAALRNAGEDYLDFAWGRGPEFTESDVDRVKAHFARLHVKYREIE